MPATVIRAAAEGVPTMVLVREPVRALVSFLIRSPDVPSAAAARGYLRFYEPLLPHQQGFVTATFEEVVGSFGVAIRRLNDRFGTDFSPFEHTLENVRRIEEEIERDYVAREGRGERLEAVIPRPSATRDASKAHVAERVRRIREIRRRAAEKSASGQLVPQDFTDSDDVELFGGHIEN